MGQENVVTYKPAVVTQITVENLEPNPHNPRRLFDKAPMEILRESIRKLGVLVPITVYPKIKTATNPQKDQFVLLDGERRWRCVKSLHMPSVPAIIVDQPSDTQNILTMFHIHNLRLGWQLMPTALKLKVLMDTLREKNEKRLAELTKLSISQIRRCKILLSYPKKFQNMMLAPPRERLKADFFIELQRIRGSALKERFPPWIKRGDTKCIDIVLEKYLNHTIKAVTEFRILAELYRGSFRTGQTKRFYSELDRFLSKERVRIRDLDIPGATFEREYREVLRSTKRLYTQIKALDPEVISANEQVFSPNSRKPLWWNCHVSHLPRHNSIYAAHSTEIERAAQDFGDHEGVTAGKIVRWISNFSDQHGQVATKILRNVRYYSSSNIRSMTYQLVKIVQQGFASIPWDKVVFVPIGEPYAGGAIIARVLRETNMIRKENIRHMVELERVTQAQVGALVFIDDFSGTGNTLKDWWPLVEPIVLPRNAPFAIALLVLNGMAREIVESLTDKVFCIDELDENDNVLSPKSTKFNPPEKDIILYYCNKTGCTADYVRGYGNCGLLVAFKYGCPNNSLPILWHKSSAWEPLFKRRGL